MARTYKDSGIPWIGEIPQEWGIYRIKYNTFLKGRIGWQGLNSNDFLDEGYCLITGTDFDNKGGINWDTCYRISKERFDEDELLHIKCGDLLMTKDGTVGKMAYIKYLPEEASLNSHLLIIRQLSKLMDNAFLYWVMLSPVFKEFCAIYQAGSIMSSISQSTLGLFSCQLPPLSEQQRIAEFLDRKCEEIDELIGLQGDFIEELKAYKQSLITETVIRGLNHNAKLKPSGIDWIGEIPETWEMCRLKDAGFLYGGLTGKSGEDFNVDENTTQPYLFYIPFTNIFNNSVINPNQLCKVKIEDGEKQNLVKKDDLFFLMSSEDFDGVGKPAILEADIDNLCLNSFCKGFRITNKGFYPKFLFYHLSSHLVREMVRQEAKGFIRINLRQDKLACVSIMQPPLLEQQQIADYLDKKCSEIDSLIAIKQQKIEELKDYKKSIIYEYVTGKREIK